jgi:DNA-binding XRE family transcriptional regulator
MYYSGVTEVNAMNEIERLQKYLLLVRRTVGWSAEEFGERIGVTRQTINNLEAGRNKLTKTQYIAMRSVLDAEIAAYPDETEMLRLILDVFVDNPDKYKEEDKEIILNQANMVTPSILAGSTSRKDVSKSMMTFAAAMGVMLGALGPIASASGSSAWIAKTILGKKK